MAKQYYYFNMACEFVKAINLLHNQVIADGLDDLGAALKTMAENGVILRYDKIHKVFGEGNFVLVVSFLSICTICISEHTAMYKPKV